MSVVQWGSVVRVGWTVGDFIVPWALGSRGALYMSSTLESKCATVESISLVSHLRDGAPGFEGGGALNMSFKSWWRRPAARVPVRGSY